MTLDKYLRDMESFTPKSERPMRMEPPPRDQRKDRCCVCNSPALLRPGYCACGEAVCIMCVPRHTHDGRGE